jgi:hypothetical protein
VRGLFVEAGSAGVITGGGITLWEGIIVEKGKTRIRYFPTRIIWTQEQIIPIVLKIVTRLDRELNCSSNGVVLEGNESDLEEIRWIYEKVVCI